MRARRRQYVSETWQRRGEGSDEAAIMRGEGRREGSGPLYKFNFIFAHFINLQNEIGQNYLFTLIQ